MGFARYGVDHVMPSAKLDSNYSQLKESMLKVFSTFENAGKYRIDDFKYVTVTPGATADKIISGIRGNVMTQGEFLDKFVEKLFTEVFTTRAEVYAAPGRYSGACSAADRHLSRPVGDRQAEPRGKREG